MSTKVSRDLIKLCGIAHIGLEGYTWTTVLMPAWKAPTPKCYIKLILYAIYQHWNPQLTQGIRSELAKDKPVPMKSRKAKPASFVFQFDGLLFL